MAKSKGKNKKAAPKKKSAKPAAKKSSKPAKKAAPKAKKAKPVAKKSSKPAKKAAPKAKKAKLVAKRKATPKRKAKAVKKTLKKKAPKAKAAPKKKVKAVKAVKKYKVKKEGKPSKSLARKLSETALMREPKKLYNMKTKPVDKKAEKRRKAPKDLNLRYSDEELKEFKDLIDKKLLSARDELKYLKEALENHNETQMGNKAWNMEEGTDTSEMETLMNQISRQHTYIRNLEMALMRIENKTYGICRVTGQLIPKQRLRIVPHATLSLEAKMTRKSEDASPGLEAAVAPPADISEGFED